MREDTLDDLVAEALTADEREFLAGLDDPSLMQQGIDLFRGRHRVFNLFVAFVMLVFLALFVYCTIRFFGTDDVSAMLRWGAGLFYCFLMIFGMKIWGWMDLHSTSVRRELKRIELQLASLNHRLDARSAPTDT